MLLLVLSLLLFLYSSNANVGCISDSGFAVDWFIIFKINNGYNYAYADSRSPSIKLSSYTLDSDTDGAIANTLSQAYGSDATAKNYAVWNDEKPTGDKSTSRGHTKGFLAFDNDYGFWLIHSIPKFPAYGDTYKGLDDGGKYGQTMFCTTHGINEFNTIGKLLQSYNPWYYASNIEDDIANKVVYLSDSINGDHDTGSDFHQVDIRTKAGNKLVSFGKPANCVKDIYNEIISEHYGADTYAESWMNGINPLPSYCTSDGHDYNTQNIRTLDIGGSDFAETQDHSKWCIVKDTNTVCFGGLNRQRSQQARYGGFACFEQPELYESMMNLITDIDQCN